MDCNHCWQIFSSKNLKLKNPKYYNPKYEKVSKKHVSNTKHCKPLYTKCDYLIEKSVHQNIIKLEQLFKEYQNVVKREVESQKELINDMWIQSQKYLILTRSVARVKPYPEIVSISTEERVLCRFHTSLTKIKRSNYILSRSMENIRKSICELDRLCKQIDKTVKSPFINGTCELYSLDYTKNMLKDLFHYFYSNLCKMICWAQLLDPGDSVSTEDYMNLIKSNKENDLIENLSKCNCFRNKIICV